MRYATRVGALGLIALSIAACSTMEWRRVQEQADTPQKAWGVTLDLLASDIEEFNALMRTPSGAHLRQEAPDVVRGTRQAIRRAHTIMRRVQLGEITIPDGQSQIDVQLDAIASGIEAGAGGF